MATVKFESKPNVKNTNAPLSIKDNRVLKKSKVLIKALFVSVCFNVGFLLFILFNN